MANNSPAAPNGAYKKVLAARAKGRPTGMDFISGLITDFTELHGDRRFGDDPAIVAGIGRLCGRPVTVVALEKGHDTRERMARNFGSAHPEGYRKALRMFEQAEKFGRPVVNLVDTSGAYCGLGAEERGQGLAIAENLTSLIGLRVPVISVLIGEGGSGGALALAVADRVWMLENAIYSVISPEGCASILWKDASKVKEASECLRLTAGDLRELGVVDRVVHEPASGFGALYVDLRDALAGELARLSLLPQEQLLQERYEKYRKMGEVAGC